MKHLTILLLIITRSFFVFSQTEGTIESSGSKLYYRSYGKGIPILIINGGPGMNSDGFLNLAMQLSTHHKTIIYDQRGTGKSTLTPVDNSTITMDLMIQDIENLRKHLQIDQWIILGHSFGGILASYYATIHPQHIKSMILSSSGGINLGLLDYVGKNINAHLTKEERDGVTEWTGKIARGDTSYYARLQRGLNLAPAYVYNKENVKIIAERLTQGNSTLNDLVWQNLRAIKFDCADKLAAAKFPVLIIQGKQDIVSEQTAEQSHAAFKNSRVVLLDHCVHYGWLDNKEKYFEEVNSFLNR